MPLAIHVTSFKNVHLRWTISVEVPLAIHVTSPPPMKSMLLTQQAKVRHIYFFISSFIWYTFSCRSSDRVPSILVCRLMPSVHASFDIFRNSKSYCLFLSLPLSFSPSFLPYVSPPGPHQSYFLPLFPPSCILSFCIPPPLPLMQEWCSLSNQ